MQAYLRGPMLRLLAATLLWLALVAAPASAATVEDLKPCYVSASATDAERETIVVRGEGFAQVSTIEVLFDGVVVGSALTGSADDEREGILIRGTDFAQLSTVEVLFDGVLMGSAPTGSIGEFEIRFPAPFQAKGERELVVSVRDAASQVDKTTRVTNLAMMVNPKRASPRRSSSRVGAVTTGRYPRRRVRFRGRGFTLAAPLFAHYLFGGREQRTVRLARLSTTPCGSFSVKRRLIPVEKARTGRWIMHVDQKRTYSPEPDPVWVRRPIDVTQVIP